MIARFDGECASCDGAIFAGRDEIIRDADGYWVHARIEDCGAELVADVRRPVNPQACRRCQCVVPCWCDEPDLPPWVPLERPDAADQALGRAVATQQRREAIARGEVDPFDGFL